MFVKLTTAVLALSAFAAATDYQCNTGTALCCDGVAYADSEAVRSLISQLGLPIGYITTDQVGLGCSPIPAGGANCLQHPLCCTVDDFNGLIAVGCTQTIAGV